MAFPQDSSLNKIIRSYPSLFFALNFILFMKYLMDLSDEVELIFFFSQSFNLSLYHGFVWPPRASPTQPTTKESAYI